jgi:hypothetical protein
MPKRPTNSAFSAGRGSASIGDLLCTPIDTVDGLDLANKPYTGDSHPRAEKDPDEPK